MIVDLSNGLHEQIVHIQTPGFYADKIWWEMIVDLSNGLHEQIVHIQTPGFTLFSQTAKKHMNDTHILDNNKETTKAPNKTSILKLKSNLTKKDQKKVARRTSPIRKSARGAVAVAHNPSKDKKSSSEKITGRCSH